MKRVGKSLRAALAGAVALGALAGSNGAWAWGQSGHRIIGYLAVEQLPPELPQFIRAAAVDAGEYARELDRSKGSGRAHDADRDAAHFVDLDDQGRAMGGPSIDSLPPTREAYEAALQAVHSNSWDAGYLPYEIVSAWQQLREDFAYWRVLTAALQRPIPADHRAWFEADLRRRELLTLADLARLEHLVGDGSQPLHVSIHFNGWGTGPNPHGYTTDRIHARFEGEYVQRNVTMDPVRAAMVSYHSCSCTIEQRTGQYIHHTLGFVEPLYQLWGQNAFAAGDARGRDFTVARLADGATELRDLIIEAWRGSETQRVGFPNPVSAADVVNGADPYNQLHGGD
jgi:hypothetical protein